MIKKIILNIPYSSAKFVEGCNGWTDKKELESLLYKWTDWRTDIIFVPPPRKNIIPCIFEYSRFCIDVGYLGSSLQKETQKDIIYEKYDNITRSIGKDRCNRLMKIYDDYVQGLRSHMTKDTLIINCHSFLDENHQLPDILIEYGDDISRPTRDCLKTIVNILHEHGLSVSEKINHLQSFIPKSQCLHKSIIIGLNKRIYLNEKELRADAYKIAAVLNRIYETLLSGSYTIE